ncbi:U3 small nucleolar RNA-associated protein 22 [Fusarium oxysporum f. sp. albedinis]|nr:U3 small nucleolar RNA-associated protein 22 [Fusarium oxysporum f. sp. albedinis]
MSRRSSPYDVTESNCGPLRFAIESGSLELVKLLCHYGADANTTFGQFETSPLEWAFRTRHIEIARFFLTQGASLDYLCYRGWTPAMLLFQKDFPEVPPEFFGLLSCNSFTDIDVQDRYGATVLHRAALWGTIGDINALLRLGASPLLMDTDVGWTPAFGAASMNNAAVLKRLVEIMLPDFVHHIDFRGRTILHIAIESGGPEAIVFALELGADPHQPSRIVVDEGGAATEVTPYEFANLKGSDIYEVFIRALQMVGHSISTVEGLYVLGYSGAKVHMTRLVYHAGIIRRRNSA